MDKNAPDANVDKAKVDTTPKPTGSPSNNASETPKNAPPGPQSTKSLVPGTTTKDGDPTAGNSISDNTGGKAADPIPTSPPSNSQPPILPPDDTGIQNYRGPLQDADEQEKTDANQLTKDEERQLERILDNDDPYTDPNRAAIQQGVEPSAITKIRKIVASIPHDTPNEHTVWGAAGIVLTVGDFRELVKTIA